MNRLDEFVTRRHEIAKIYDEQLFALPVVTPFQELNTYSMVIYTRLDSRSSSPATQKQVYDHLRKMVLRQPSLYTCPSSALLRKARFKSGDFPEAENFTDKG